MTTPLPGPLSAPAAVVLPVAFVCGKLAQWCRAPGRRRASMWAATLGAAASCWADRGNFTGGRAIAHCWAYLVIWGTFWLGMGQSLTRVV